MTRQWFSNTLMSSIDTPEGRNWRVRVIQPCIKQNSLLMIFQVGFFLKILFKERIHSLKKHIYWKPQYIYGLHFRHFQKSLQLGKYYIIKIISKYKHRSAKEALTVYLVYEFSYFFGSIKTILVIPIYYRAGRITTHSEIRDLSQVIGWSMSRVQTWSSPSRWIS